jgi:hypothetical protein
MRVLKAIAIAAIVGGIPGVFTSWLITGVLSHPFQRATPATWRRHEGGAQYAGASATKFLLAALMATLVAMTGGVHAFGVTSSIGAGVLLAVLCWAAGTLPALLSVGLFVNLHLAVVAGLLLDWLIVSTIAGATGILRRTLTSDGPLLLASLS